MNFPKILSLIAFLNIRCIDSSLSTPAQNNQPYWQLVLREFVFRTISSSEPNDNLHKKLLDAPFYGGPLPIASNDENDILSAGNVYRVSKDDWIFCQDDCQNCDFCNEQTNPIIKWVLTRVRQWTRMEPPKWDLKLIVTPQAEEKYASSVQSNAPSMAKDKFGEQLFSFPTNQAIVVEQNTENLDRASRKGRLASLTKQRSRNLSSAAGGKSDAFSTGVDKDRQDNFRSSRTIGLRNITRPKRGRVNSRSGGRQDPLTFYYPQEDLSRMNRPADRSQDDSNPRLIMGIDQRGAKHLVHVVPLDLAFQRVQRPEYTMDYRDSYENGNSLRTVRTIQDGSDGAAYEKLIDRILESLKTYRSLIQTFIFSDRLQLAAEKEPVMSPYPSYLRGVNDEEYSSFNEPVYRKLPSPRSNRYSVDSVYQQEEAEEQEQSYRPYPDRTSDVNRPPGVYEDQMIEYESYRANDQAQDEGSLPQAERRRRNSFRKLTNSSSTSEHQGIGENHTGVDNTVSFAGGKLDENSYDQGLGDLQLEFNQTDTYNLESTTAKIENDEVKDFS